MSFLKRLFDLYINSSIHVSLAVVALAVITYIEFEITKDIGLLFFLFFGSVSGYNFVKYAEVAGLHHRSLTKSLREIQVFSFLCGLGLLLSLFWLSREALLVSFCLGVLTLFYAVPIFSSKRNLRAVTGIKIYIIASVWTGTTVLLPIIHSGYAVTSTVLLVMLQRVIFIIILMIPFEIRDLKYDNKDLKTLPQLIGVNRAKTAGYVMIFCFLGMQYLLGFELLTRTFIIYTFLAIILVVFIYFANSKNSRYFTSFWVESIPIFWMSGVLLSNYF